MDNEPRWEQLAVAVKAARGMRSQKAIADAGGPSDTTISKIEANEWRPTRAVEETLRKLDQGLAWGAGTAAGILAGHIAINRDAKRQNYTRQQREIAFLERRAFIEAKPEKDRTPEEKDWLVQTLAARNSVVHRVRDTPAAESPHIATMVELSFLSDDAESAASGLMEPDLSDEQEVENYIWEVGELVSAVEYLTQAVHDAAVDAAGSAERLRRIKREIRRARTGPDIFDLLTDLERESKPSREAAQDPSRNERLANDSQSPTSELEISDTGGQNRRLPSETNSQRDRDAVDADARVSASETDSSITELGEDMPSDSRAAKMTDAELQQAAAADPLWADYIKTKRPELVDDGWDF